MPTPKLPHSRHVYQKIKDLYTTAPDITYTLNRNPRNLEMLRIAFKNEGYQLEIPEKSYWIKLGFDVTARYVTAKAVHFQSGPIITASTSEWTVKKQLYKTNDTSAYINLAKVFSKRCLQSGITEIRCDLPKTGLFDKLNEFLKEIDRQGIILKEASRFKPPKRIDTNRDEKPWNVMEQ